LLKEDDVLLVQPEEALLLEERLSVLPRRPARHNEPGDLGSLPSSLLVRNLLQPPDPLRLVLEQRLPARQPDVEASLWSRRPEPRSLTSRHEQDGDLRFGDGFESGLSPCHRLLGRGENGGGAVGGEGLDVVDGDVRRLVRLVEDLGVGDSGLLELRLGGKRVTLLGFDRSGVDSVHTFDVERVELGEERALLGGGEGWVEGQEMGLAGGGVTGGDLVIRGGRRGHCSEGRGGERSC
jgi:hypothetical protein